MDLELEWFGTADGLLSAVEGRLQTMRAADLQIASEAQIDAYCVHCRSIKPFMVDGGARFGPDVNLREGLVCQNCGLNARSRQMFLAARKTFLPRHQLALLEAFSPLSRYLAAVWQGIRLSEFHSPEATSGERRVFHDHGAGEREATHQDMLALSYPDASLDGIIHNDVLEHVPDAARGLAECRRVLVPGGVPLFTMPWFPWLPETLKRGSLDEAGALVEHLPTELHGDGLRPEGIYTFYNFGADFVRFLREAGFSSIAFGLCYEPRAGLTTNNYRYGDEFLMLPTVVRAVR